MANEVRFSSTVSIIQDVGGSLGAEQGITYTNKQHDGNADYRKWGGKYSLPAYDDDAVAYWKQKVIDVTSAQALSDGTAFEGNPAVSDGTLPVKVQLIAVEYTAELGTVGQVVVTIGTQVLAELSVGEDVVIPISGASGAGLVIANVKIHADVYSDGVHEATVNVLLVGQNA